MSIDSRIKKLTAGVTSRDAALAHARAAAADPQLTDAERSEADEFAGTVEGMFLMAAVDGIIADEEIQKLSEGIRHMIGKDSVDDATLMRWLDELHERLEDEGWSRRLDQVASKLPTAEARMRAFRLAAAVAMVDDHVAHAEAAAIDAFSAALGLDDDASSRILREVQEELFGPG